MVLFMLRVFWKVGLRARGYDLPSHKKERRVAGHSAAEVTVKREKGSGCESNKEKKTWSDCSSFRHFCMPHMNKPLQVQRSMDSSRPGEVRGSQIAIQYNKMHSCKICTKQLILGKHRLVSKGKNQTDLTVESKPPWCQKKNITPAPLLMNLVCA